MGSGEKMETKTTKKSFLPSHPLGSSLKDSRHEIPPVLPLKPPPHLCPPSQVMGRVDPLLRETPGRFITVSGKQLDWLGQSKERSLFKINGWGSAS